MMPTAATAPLPLVRILPGRIRRAIGFLRRVYAAWKQDQGSRMAAALAFYTLLALTPLLVLAVLIIIKHTANIRRLLSGTELKFGASPSGSAE